MDGLVKDVDGVVAPRHEQRKICEGEPPLSEPLTMALGV